MNNSLTVGELIGLLRNQRPDIHIAVEWDGALSTIDKISLQTNDYAEPVVVLDVSDYNSYGREQERAHCHHEFDERMMPKFKYCEKCGHTIRYQPT